MKIMFLLPTCNYGGPERMCLSLARHLPPHHDTTFAFLSSNRHPAILAEAEHVANTVIAGSGNPKEDRTITIDHMRQADVIISNGCHLLADIRKNVDTPVIALSHCSGEWEQQCLVVREEIRGADFVAAVSETAAGAFAGELSGKVTVVPIGAEIDRTAPKKGYAFYRKHWNLAEERKVLLFLGRLAQVKRPSLAVKILRELPAEWVLVMAGDGPLGEHVSRTAERLAEDRVIFVEPTVHIGDMLDVADVMISTSESEAMPLVYLEAWLGSVPVVCRNHQFAQEIATRHGELMLKTVPNDADTKKWAAKVVEATETPKEIIRLSKMVAERTYSAAAMANRWEGYLQHVVNTWTEKRSASSHYVSTNFGRQKRALILYDVEGWAYYLRAMNLARYSPSDWSVEFLDRLPHNLKQYDLLFFLPYGKCVEVFTEIGNRAPHIRLVGACNVAPDRRQSYVHTMTSMCDAIIHNSVKSYETWSQMQFPGARARHYQISNGVDLETFKMITPASERKTAVLWMSSEYHRKQKGEDVIDWLSNALEVDAKIVDSHAPPMKPDAMAEWYNTGKVYLVVSESEGTPNPALEAAACGCNIVATPVGNMPELIKDGVNGLLLPRMTKELQRDLTPVFDIIMRATNNETMRAAMQETIKEWSWENRARRYFDLFDHVLDMDLPGPEWNVCHKDAGQEISALIGKMISH